MSVPSQICNNCAPIFFEYFQKNLETQAELRRLRDQIQRINFTQELGSLKDASGIDLSISPQTKHQPNSKIRGKRATALNLAGKENPAAERQSSIITSLTAARSLTPSEKFRLHTHGDVTQRNNLDIFTNINTTVQTVAPNSGLISPLERLRDFETQINKKVDSFKQKLREIAKSANRPSYIKEYSSRPKTTGKVLTTQCDEVNKSDPKVSMFSPGNMTAYHRASPIEFNLTPKLESKERTDKGSGPSKGEWTVGTTLNQRVNTLNTDRELSTHTKKKVESSMKKIKESFHNELEVIRTRSKEVSSPAPRNHHDKLHSPFFSPLRASELMTPGGHHTHPKTDDSKRNYANFIKLTSTPLLNSIMSSPGEQEGKREVTNENVMSFVGAQATEKKGSYRSNYYKELFEDPLEQSPTSGLIKTDKAIGFGSSKKNYNQDDLQTIRDEAKVGVGYNSITSRNQGSTALLLENRNKSEEGDYEQMFESNYDRTRRKKTYDYSKTNKSPAQHGEQSESWYLAVNMKGGRFYSINDKNLEYKIGETTVNSLKTNDLNIEGGVLVYNSVSEAMKNKFDLPKSGEPISKTVLEVRVQGPNLQVNKNASLYSAVTPIKAIYGDFGL